MRRAWILFFTLPGAAALGWWLRGRDTGLGGEVPPAGRELPSWTLGISTTRTKTCLVLRQLDPDRDRCRREAMALRERLGLVARDPGGPGRHAPPAPRSFLQLHVFCFPGAESWEPGLAGCVLAGVRRDGRPFLAEPLVRLPREPGTPAAEVVRTALSGGDSPVAAGTSRTFLFACPEEIDLAQVEALELQRGSSIDPFIMRELLITEWEEFLREPVPGGPGMPTVANTPERR